MKAGELDLSLACCCQAELARAMEKNNDTSPESVGPPKYPQHFLSADKQINRMSYTPAGSPPHMATTR